MTGKELLPLLRRIEELGGPVQVVANPNCAYNCAVFLKPPMGGKMATIVTSCDEKVPWDDAALIQGAVLTDAKRRGWFAAVEWMPESEHLPAKADIGTAAERASNLLEATLNAFIQALEATRKDDHATAK